MVKIKLEKSKIIIDGSDNPIILEWEHRSFFTLASGFRLNSKKQQYVYSTSLNFRKILIETIDYLTDEGIEFSADVNISKLINEFRKEQIEYEESIEVNKEIRKKKEVSVYPVGLIRQLKWYQRKGFEHLLSIKNGANFSVPGSGKTSIIYAVFEKLRQEKNIQIMLVIGPRSCFQPWEEEAKACFAEPINIARLSGAKAVRQSIYLQVANFQVLLCTYQTATNDRDEIISLCKKYRVFIVIDESHNIKSFAGGKWAETMLEISPHANRRAILSGTPIPNNLMDLWSQITFLWPGEQVLGDRNSYRFKCENETDIKGIKEAVKPFIFRTTKRELGLPKQEFQYHYCDLKPYQQKIYSALSAKILQEFKLGPAERIALREWRKAKIVRLIQAATNPALLAKFSDEFDVPPLSGESISPIRLIEKYPKYETPAKFEAAIKSVRDLLDLGEKVVLWTTFVFNIQMLQKALGDWDPFIVYGAVPKDATEDIEFNREQQIKCFKESKNPVVLIANPAACAESISLHKVCHHAVYLDRTFNCGQYLQSLDRIHRIGLNPNEIVTYHLIIASKTIDETIDRRLKEKEIKMLQILEDELPIGSFEAEEHQIGQSEDEEKIDFDNTIEDIKKFICPEDIS